MALVVSVPIPIPIPMPRFKNGQVIIDNMTLLQGTFIIDNRTLS